MKGIVFREFMSFVEARAGADMLDSIIEDSALSNGGAYTAVGTYPFSDMQALLGSAVRHTGQPAETLLSEFGRHTGCSFARNFRHYFDQAGSLFDFLAQVEGYIHVEVLKLYPDAELPSLVVVTRTAEHMVLRYRSSRRLHHFAKGVILASASHFAEPVEVEIAVEPAAEADWAALITVRHAASA